jgi:hypothetical protein
MTASIDRETYELRPDEAALPPALRVGTRAFTALAGGRPVHERLAPGAHADLVLARLFRQPSVERVVVR